MLGDKRRRGGKVPARSISRRLGQATLITLAFGPGFAGLTAAALWLGQRRRAGAGAARGGFWV